MDMFLLCMCCAIWFVCGLAWSDWYLNRRFEREMVQRGKDLETKLSAVNNIVQFKVKEEEAEKWQ